MYEENVRGIIYSYITSNIFLFSFIHALPQLSFLSVQVVRPWIWPSCKTQVSEARWFKIWQGHRYGDNNDWQVSHCTTNKITVCPAKSRISLGICPVWSESSLCAEWVAKGPSFLHADSKDSDQTGRMPFVSFVMRRFWLASPSSVTVKILKIQTQK